MTAQRSPHTARADAEFAADAAPDDLSYDAFISYSGFRKPGDASEFDRKVARHLHRALESYRVPRALLKSAGGRAPVPQRFKKIFRDQDEVRVSSDLNDSLTEALRRSRFLIVICSPRARQSRWINQEIAIFRDLGRGEQILPLLIEGEPAEAFPEELFKTRPKNLLPAEPRGAPEALPAQPLAADIRAPSVSKSLRLLKQEKFRLLAAMLGCEYDDLRRREHERFVRRTTTAGVVMLTVLLALTTLSVQLFFAWQRESRNRQLALDSNVRILTMVGLNPNAPLGANDPTSRELNANIAIKNLEMVREDDPEDLKCLTTLRALYGVRGGLLMDRGRKAEGREAFQKAGSMALPITLSRLKSWRPREAGGAKEPPGDALSFPNDYDLNRLRTLLAIRERSEAADIRDALDYSEVAAEYLLLLDISTAEGRVEARRVLQSSLSRFQQARSLQALTPQQEELAEAVSETLSQL